ncbi:hypothetical protein GDO86_006756 [Hymenochirus boettgeri]|uniref:Uncharacterized protein n=1 Tax=Hymenochirus boettgeri TaxID=247094 RepID=A0A8T2J7G1_9PIPI|nr:hypothetical protein GDO86_006756 [Hymenochirus boettgeri]
MDLHDLENGFSLTLDDFIPPHLQRKQESPKSNPEYKHWVDQQYPANEEIFSSTVIPITHNMIISPEQRKERHWIRYEGIGPTDKDGMPFASRSSVDKPRDWYRNMFKVLHRLSDSDDSDQDSEEKTNQNLSMPSKSGQAEYNQWNYDAVMGQTTNASSAGLSPPLRGLEQSQSFTLRDPQRIISPIHRESQRSTNSPSKESQRTFVSPSMNSPHIVPHSYLNVFSGQTTLSSPPRESIMAPISPLSDPYCTLSSTANKRAQMSPGLSATKTDSKCDSFSSNPGNLDFASNKHSKDPQKKLNNDLAIQNNTVHLSPGLMPQSLPHLGHGSPWTTATERFSSNTHPPKSMFNSTKEEANYTKDAGYCPDSTSKVLDQLENELRLFTEELDRELDDHGHTPVHTLTTLATVPQPPPVLASALVKFDFLAESPKELSLKRGSTVQILKRVDKNWLLGEQDSRRGLFPENYVRVTYREKQRLDPGISREILQESAVAMYDFKAESDAELSLHKGQHVAIIQKVGSNWFKGRVEGSERIGLFPVSYVQLMGQRKEGTSINRKETDKESYKQVSPGVAQTDKKPMAPYSVQTQVGTKYRVLYAFTPNNPDELELIPGDIVTVTQHCDDGWYVGVCWRTNTFGSFPGNFLTRI